MDIFCGCSEAVFIDLIDCGIRKHKCCYIDNGVDFSSLNNGVSNGKEIYGIKDKKVLMIYGTHFYRKGVDIAIDAIKDIVEKYNIVLMIVCQNKDFVLDQIKKMFNYIPEWIIVMPSQENIAFYFKMSDIYLTPSREEGFSYAMLESIYCGTPVIRSNIPAMDRKIPNDINVPTNDVFALRQCIELTLSLTDSSKQTILTLQKEYIVQRWNIIIWSNKIINMYLNVINSGHCT
jgi:glycosyltransferase involved in cell wall biosynthesis